MTLERGRRSLEKTTGEQDDELLLEVDQEMLLYTLDFEEEEEEEEEEKKAAAERAVRPCRLSRARPTRFGQDARAISPPLDKVMFEERDLMGKRR